MEKLNLESIRLFLAEPNRQVRHALKTGLHSQGFRQTDDGATLESVGQAISAGIDALICDADLSDGDPCALFNDIRHHRQGDNPFLPIIAMSADSSPRRVREVMNSGADDLVVKPVSSGLLHDRLLNLIRGRKPFVVTTDYIGPDRRRSPRPERHAVPLVEVPNPLRAKATGEMDQGALAEAIARTSETINDQKIERHAGQVIYLVERLAMNYREQEPNPDSIGQHVRRLLGVLIDIRDRLFGSPFEDLQASCQTLIKVAERLRDDGASPSPKDVAVLDKVSRELARSFPDVPTDTLQAVARKRAAEQR